MAKQEESKMHAPFSRSLANHKPATPETAMAAAFLRALVRLVDTGAHHSKDKIAIPTGNANIGEIELILCALGLIRDDRRAPR